jgi:hypothetical protein
MMLNSAKILAEIFESPRTFTILYGPGETLQDAIDAAGIYPAPWDLVIAVWSKCDDIPAEWRLVSVERDGLRFAKWAQASGTIH